MVTTFIHINIGFIFIFFSSANIQRKDTTNISFILLGDEPKENVGGDEAKEKVLKNTEDVNPIPELRMLW